MVYFYSATSPRYRGAMWSIFTPALIAKALIEQEQAEIVFAAKGGVRSNPARATTATAATRIALPELPEHHDAKNLRRVLRSSP